MAVNLLALSGNDVLFAGKDNLAAKVVRGNFTTTTPSSTSTLSATSTTSQMPVKTAIIDKATSGGFFAKKIAAQRQLQVKLPTQLSLGQQGVTVVRTI